MGPSERNSCTLIPQGLHLKLQLVAKQSQNRLSIRNETALLMVAQVGALLASAGRFTPAEPMVHIGPLTAHRTHTHEVQRK